MISGSTIGLRSVEKKDLEILRNWRNNPNFRKYFREWKEISTFEQEKWFEELYLYKDKSIMFSVIELKNNEVIGCAGFNYTNWISNSSELSIYIGQNNVYIDENGYAEDICKTLFNYGFNELNFHKVWAEIYEYDDKKINLFEKLNMKRDGKLRDNCYYNGKYWDSLIYSIIQEEWS